MASILGSLAAGGAQALVGGGISRLFGGKKAKAPPPVKPIGFTGGGLATTAAPSGVTVTRTGELSSALQGLSGARGVAATGLQGLLSQVKPGFGKLTESAVQTIQNRKQAAISNLRENLSRRGVLGSSFAQDAIARAEAEFAQQEQQVRAESFLQELDTSAKLIDQVHQASAQQFADQIAQFQFEAGVAQNLTQIASSVMSQNAQVQQQLLQTKLSGISQAGAFFQPAITKIGEAVAGSSLFK